METTPSWNAQFRWLAEEEERVRRDESALARFGTVYARYGTVPHRPCADKPTAHTYLTHARRLIPRKRAGRG